MFRRRYCVHCVSAQVVFYAFGRRMYSELVGGDLGPEVRSESEASRRQTVSDYT